MYMQITKWLKLNWVNVVLGGLVVFLLLKGSTNYPMSARVTSSPASLGGVMMNYATDAVAEPAMMKSESSVAPLPVTGGGRMVSRQATLSMKVDDVKATSMAIEEIANGVGGYMTNSESSQPEESASGSIVIRVPAKDFGKVAQQIRDLGVKVVSESVFGNDITDQYDDYEARLATLVKTKAKFEELLDNSTEVADLLNVQRELVSLQSQIDSIKGQQKYMEQSANTVPVSVYMSTDEYSLPYVPASDWRPQVVFKEAVRAMVLSVRGVANKLIWLVVYSVIWLPLLLIGLYLKRKLQK